MKKLKYIYLSLALIIFDQLTKIWTRFYFEHEGDSIQVFGDIFRLTWVENPGAAFGIKLSNPLYNRIVLGVITTFAIVFIGYLFIQAKSKMEQFAFSMIMGGAIGNFIDRIFRGSVTDLFDSDFPDAIAQLWGATRWPVFNIADSVILIGFSFLIIDQFLYKSKKTEEK